MSLDNFQISPLLVTQLYKNSLITLDNRQANTEIEKSMASYIQGGNTRRILVLSRANPDLAATKQETDFLQGILKACNLSYDDISLCSWPMPADYTYQDVQNTTRPVNVILFGTGIEILNLPIRFPNYQVQKYEDVTYLIAPALSEIAASQAEKKLLWDALRKVFAI